MGRHRQARGSARIPHLVAAIATVVAGVAIGPIDRAAAVPTQEAEALPLLWSGTLTDSAGNPTSGRVAAFVRPPAAAIPKVSPLTPASKAPALRSIPLGEAQADDSGWFEIRALPPTDAIPASYHKPDGSLDVMIVAEAAGGGWTLATDTMQFLDEPGVARAWFSSPERYDKATAQAAALQGGSAEADAAPGRDVSALAIADAEAAADGERPSTLQARLSGSPMRARPEDGVATAAVPPGGGYQGCTATGTTATGTAFRTLNQVDAVTYWDMWATYSNMRGTGFAVGVSVNGSSGWSVGGSANFSQGEGQTVVHHANSGPYNPYRQKFQIGTHHSKIRWSCASTTIPGNYTVYTAEATGVNWATRADFSTAIGCSAGNSQLVASNGSFMRWQDSRATFAGSASIWGFSGSATVTYGSYSAHSWVNNSVYNRYLCGESAWPATGHTRIRASH